MCLYVVLVNIGRLCKQEKGTSKQEETTQTINATLSAVNGRADEWSLGE